MNRLVKKSIVSLTACLLLSACGGSGSDSGGGTVSPQLVGSVDLPSEIVEGSAALVKVEIDYPTAQSTLNVGAASSSSQGVQITGYHIENALGISGSPIPEKSSCWDSNVQHWAVLYPGDSCIMESEVQYNDIAEVDGLIEVTTTANAVDIPVHTKFVHGDDESLNTITFDNQPYVFGIDKVATIRVTNTGNYPVNNVHVNLEGVLSKKASVSPMFLEKLNVGETVDFVLTTVEPYTDEDIIEINQNQQTHLLTISAANIKNGYSAPALEAYTDPGYFSGGFSFAKPGNQSVIFKNRSDVDLDLESIDSSEVPDGVSVLDDTCSQQTLLPNAECQIKLNATDSAQMSESQGYLALTYYDQDDSSFNAVSQVSVAGVTVDAPENLVFVQGNPSSLEPYTGVITITNNGPFNWFPSHTISDYITSSPNITVSTNSSCLLRSKIAIGDSCLLELKVGSNVSVGQQSVTLSGGNLEGQELVTFNVVSFDAVSGVLTDAMPTAISTGENGMMTMLISSTVDTPVTINKVALPISTGNAKVQIVNTDSGFEDCYDLSTSHGVTLNNGDSCAVSIVGSSSSASSGNNNVINGNLAIETSLSTLQQPVKSNFYTQESTGAYNHLLNLDVFNTEGNMLLTPGNRLSFEITNKGNTNNNDIAQGVRIDVPEWLSPYIVGMNGIDRLAVDAKAKITFTISEDASTVLSEHYEDLKNNTTTHLISVSAVNANAQYPNFEISPLPIGISPNADVQFVSAGQVQTFTLTNVSDVMLGNIGTDLDDSNSEGFAIVKSSKNDCADIVQLDPNKSCNISVKVNQDARGISILDIFSDNPSGYQYTLKSGQLIAKDVSVSNTDSLSIVALKGGDSTVVHFTNNGPFDWYVNSDDIQLTDKDGKKTTATISTDCDQRDHAEVGESCYVTLQASSSTASGNDSLQLLTSENKISNNLESLVEVPVTVVDDVPVGLSNALSFPSKFTEGEAVKSKYIISAGSDMLNGVALTDIILPTINGGKLYIGGGSTCAVGMILKAGQNCVLYLNYTNTKSGNSIDSDLIIQTSVGDVSQHVKTEVVSAGDDSLPHLSISSGSIALGAGMETDIQVTNTSNTESIYDLKLAFDPSISSLTQEMDSDKSKSLNIVKLDPGKTVTFQFTLLPTSTVVGDNIDALKNNETSHLISVAADNSQSDLYPVFDVYPEVVTYTPALNFNNPSTQYISFTNNSAYNVDQMQIQYEPIQGVTIEDGCSGKTLTTQSKCEIKVSAAQNAFGSGSLLVDYDIQGEYLETLKPIDIIISKTEATVAKTKSSDVLVNGGSLSFSVKNTGGFNWTPSKTLDGYYKILQNGKTSTDVSVNANTSSSSCLKGQVVKPNATCTLQVKAIDFADYTATYELEILQAGYLQEDATTDFTVQSPAHSSVVTQIDSNFTTPRRQRIKVFNNGVYNENVYYFLTEQGDQKALDSYYGQSANWCDDKTCVNICSNDINKQTELAPNESCYVYVYATDLNAVGDTVKEKVSIQSTLSSSTTSKTDVYDFTNNRWLAVGGVFNKSSSIAYLAKWDGSNWQSLNYPVTWNSVTTMTFDNLGNLYASHYTSPDVVMYDGKTWKSLVTANNGYAIDSLEVDDDNNLYIAGSFTQLDGVNYNRIAKYDGTLHSLGSGLPAGTVYDTSTDHNGVLYACGDASVGVQVFKNGQWVTLGGLSVTGGSNIRDMAISNNNEIYVVGDFKAALPYSYSNGLKYSAEKGWGPLGNGQDLPNLNTIAVDPNDGNGNYYIGGLYQSSLLGNGVTKYLLSSNTWSPLLVGNQAISTQTIVLDNNHDVYAGGLSSSFNTSGVMKFDGKNWYALPNLGSNPLIYKVLVSNNLTVTKQ